MSELEWVFDPLPPSNSREGNWAMGHIIDPEIDMFVREVLQNARDQMFGGCVEVEFELFEFTGKVKETFLERLRWDQLRRHVEGAVEGGSVTIKADLESGLTALDDSERPLRVLRIRDRNTKGLSGGEDEPGNFRFLCKDQFVTDESEAERGGSFGIGKSVLWRFSEVSTVLFSSVVPEPSSGLLDFRLFGRCQLPSHDADGRGWAGSGWFGAREATPAGDRAVSVWGMDELEDVAGSLALARDEDSRGTSIIVVSFFEPREELPEERPLVDICEKILEAAGRWFWPAISAERPTLRVHVTGYRDRERVFERTEAGVPDEFAPFVQLANSTDAVRAHRWVVRVPGLNSEFLDAGAESMGLSPSATEAAVELRLLELPEAFAHHPENGRVALVRGAQMVVAYQDPGAHVERHFLGLLVAGRALDESPGSAQLERYLRAAEPPAHDRWEPGTERLRAEFVKRFRTQALESILSGIREKIQAEFGAIRKTNDGVSDRFKSLFAISRHGELGGSLPAAKFRDHAEAHFDGEGWRVKARVTRRGGSASWKVVVVAKLGADSGAGDRLTVSFRKLPDGVVESDGVLYVPADTGEIAFDAWVELPTDDVVPDRDFLRMQLGLSAKETGEN